jgi:hypothetical protein
MKPWSNTEIQASVQDLSERVTNLSDGIEFLYRLLGSEQDCSALLAASAPASPTVADRKRARSPVDEVLLFAAYYLEGHCAKADLPDLLSQINLQCRLMIHKNIESFLADPGAPRAEFAPSPQDGGWLWYNLDSNRCLGLPIDANVFRIPPAPSFLARLCDGVPAVGDMTITRVIRPCEFRAENDGTFTLISRGCIQNTPAAPTDFSDLLERLKPKTAAVNGTNMASILLTQLDRLGRLEDISFRIEARLKALETVPSRSTVSYGVDPQIESRLRELEGAFQRQGQALQTAAKMSTALETLGRRLDEKDTSFKFLQETVGKHGQRLSKLEPKSGMAGSRSISPAGESGMGAAGVSPPAQEPPLTSSAVLASAAASAKASPSEGRPVLAQRVSGTGKEAALPDGWSQVLSQAAAKATHEPSDYIAALAELYSSLSQMPGGSGIRLVHAHITGVRVIQIHDAAISENSVQCLSCDVSKPFSFAICAGDEGAGRLFLLLPAGIYADSNYPNGYSALLSGSRDEAFTIQSVKVPAVLRRTGGAGLAEYAVEQKMQYS